MNLLSVALLSAVLLCQTYAQPQSTCVADYQCALPYGYCKGGIDDCATTIAGIAVDEANNEIYYGVTCRPDPTSAPNTPTNSTIKKVSANGGQATTVFTTYNNPGPGNIFKLFTVVNQNLYFERALRQPGAALSAYNLQTKQEQNVNPNPGAFQYYLDIVGASYTCQLDYSANYSYNIYRYPGALGQAGSSLNGNRLYNLGSSSSFCGPLRRGSGQDIIFTRYTYALIDAQGTYTYNTTFYRGSVVGSSVLPPPFFVVVGAQVKEFDIASNGAIVYSTDNGLFRRDTTGVTTQLTGETVTGIAVFGSTIFYNNGATIRTINLNGGGQQNLIQQPTNGKCLCRPGFSGQNCQNCNGQTQFNYGTPSCVPVNQYGVPASCTQDYQCGNPPYTFCNYDSTCTCRANFTGPRCDQCASPRSLSFRNNIPYCE